MKHFYVEQDECDRDSLESAKISYTYLHNLTVLTSLGEDDRPRVAYIPTRRSCEIIPGRAKAFHAKAQSSIRRKENKAVVLCDPLRLCVRLFIFSPLRTVRTYAPPACAA